MAVGDLLPRMEASRSRLFAAITGLTEEQARARPPDGRPSASEILAHLMTWEQQLHAAIAAALAEPGPRQGSREVPGRTTPLPQLVHGLQAARRRTALLLARLEPRQLDATAVDPEGDRTTVRALLERVSAHEEEHASEIERLRSWLEATGAREQDVVTLRPAGRSE